MIQRTFQSICLLFLWSSQTFSIIFAKKTQRKMTLLSEEPELRSEFSQFVPDHPFEIKHDNNGLTFSNNFASESNIKIPNVPGKTENPSLIPPDVWSSKVSSQDGARKDIITLPDEHPHERWHLLQEEPGLPVALRKSRRQRARERDGFQRHPKPRTKDLGRGKKPKGSPGKRGGMGLRQTLPRGPWERGRDGRGLRSRGDRPRPPWSQRDEPRQLWSRRDEPQRPRSKRNRPERPWGRGNEGQRPWDHRRDGQRPWDRRRDRQQLLDQKYKSSELAKRKTRNRLRKKLAEERRAEKLKKEGVSEASRSRISEGQEQKSTLAWRTTNRESRVERTTMGYYPGTRKDDTSQRSMDEDLIKEWEEGPWTPEAWTRNTWPWGGWTKKPKRTIMRRAMTHHLNTAAF